MRREVCRKFGPGAAHPAALARETPHSSPEITREVYLHSIPADARNAVEKVEQLLNGPKRTQIVEIQKLGSQLIQ